MATVPVMSTVSAGGIGTAALWNSQVRDLGLYLLTVPHAILRETAAQSISNNTLTPVTFSVEDADTDSGHSTVTNTSRYTAVTAGTFWVACAAGIAANAAGRFELRLRVNGATDIGQVSVPNSTTASPQLSLSTDIFLNVGDYVETAVLQNSGGALNTNVVSGNPRMAVRWVST